MAEKDIQIESRDLNLCYGDAQALKNVSMNVPEDRVTAVTRPSGCGKSTFVRCINRMNYLIKDCYIARTLAVKPEVIFFDEPASVLDPISTARIKDITGELKRDYTISIVTHNMSAGRFG